MSEPTINDAKELAYLHRKTGVAVLHFGGGKFGFASYGMTRAQCRAMGALMDQIADMIETGEIVVPEELRQEVAP